VKNCLLINQLLTDLSQSLNKSLTMELEQVFNCDKSGLYYELLPTKTQSAHFEKSAAGRKTQKERVTINACSNVTGTVKLPLLFIGKAKKSVMF